MNDTEILKQMTAVNVAAWLAKKDKKEFVGKESSIEFCPLATFFFEQFAVKIKVGTPWSLDTFRIGENAERFYLPDWANDFAHAVDEGNASEQFASNIETRETEYRPTAENLLQMLRDEITTFGAERLTPSFAGQ